MSPEKPGNLELMGQSHQPMRFDKAAQQAARVDDGGTADVLSAVIETLQAKSSFQINIPMLRTAFNMQKRVLDRGLRKRGP